MRLIETASAIGAVLSLITAAGATHIDIHNDFSKEILQRRSQHTRHKHSHAKFHSTKRATTCAFPHGVGLVPVAPKGQNGGWAMSPDEPCTAGKYCPYACPPGQLMAQWDPEATEYTYPQSMNGGLYCNDDGTVSKPFPNKPYCYPGTGSIAASNKCGGSVAFCQTVLPGNEAMLIATNVDSSATLAVPGTDYWASTAAHYYINPPGVSTQEGCIWGDGSKPIGNWSPYVAGANTDGNGNTFVKVGWNPIYTGESVFQNDLPKFGVRITCDGGGCNGLPCSIDPSSGSVNSVTSGLAGNGAGGANFCVVTVQKGSQAKIETFDVGGSSSKPSKPPGTAPNVKPKEPEVKAEIAAEPEPEPEPTPEPEPEPEPTPTPTSTSIEAKPSPTTFQKVSTSSSATSSSASSKMSVSPHVFFEHQDNNSTDTNATGGGKGGGGGGGGGGSHGGDDGDDTTVSKPGGGGYHGDNDNNSDDSGEEGTRTNSTEAAATSSSAANPGAGSASSFMALAAAFVGCNILL